MADNKEKAKDPNKEIPEVSPAPHAPATEVSTNEDQYKTGPSGEPVDPEAKTATYYIRDGVRHTHVEKGEARVLDTFGQKAELSASQYKAFQDKFLTEAEYKAVKAGKDAMADGANAAETFIPTRQTAENATPEERAAAKANDAGNAHDENVIK